MELGLIHLLTLVVGVAIGAFAAHMQLRGHVGLARAEGRAEAEVERTALQEKLRAASERVEEQSGRLSAAEHEARTLNAALDSMRDERTQYFERASQVPELKKALDEANADLARQKEAVADLREANGRLQASVQERELRLEELESARREAERNENERSQRNMAIQEENATLRAELEHERRQSAEKLELLASAKQELSNQFKALASEILDEKSKKFTEQNQVNLDGLLTPLKERLTSFQKKVEEVYVNESQGRAALAEQVKILTTLNSTLREETQNLTLALTGDRKAQGTYGELLLEDVLERAGLIEGQHYQRQGGVKADDGTSHVIPDIVIRLPGDRFLVVDSKMSLPDYKLFADAADNESRQAALKRHLNSVRAHIKGLSERNYQKLYGLRSLDFVVMFIPLEPAFMVSVTNDGELFHHAWEKNVLLVSPSTLLFVVRTVANLWRQEDLSRNAQEISQKGADLYDKLVGFVNDLQRVGERIQQAQDSYHDAKKKLSEGVGNVVRQAEMLKKLGVKPSKTLPAQWIDDVEEQADAALLSGPSRRSAA